jgi:uncharacterized protein YbaR (Trm112 family)
MNAPDLDPELIALLRCPVSGQPLHLLPADPAGGAERWLLREDGRLAYPVRGGIAVLLPDAGVPREVPGGACGGGAEA